MKYPGITFTRGSLSFDLSSRHVQDSIIRYQYADDYGKALLCSKKTQGPLHVEDQEPDCMEELFVMIEKV